jgi:two-component sensor histidine kinase/GAF domain-containing protein
MADSASKDIDVWETILNMPFTNDRRSKIELAFYSELIPDLYMSGLVSQLYLSAAQSTKHCQSGGMDESVIYSFSIMGLQLGEQDEFEPAFKYEDLARDLSAKYPNTFGATRGMNGIVWCNMHSRSHPSEIVDYCQKAIQCGKNCGDLYNAGLSYGPLMWNQQVQGADLSVIEDYAKECLTFSNRYHLSFSVGLAEAMQAGWILPMKNDYSPVSMDERLLAWEQDNHIASAGSYYVHMALAHYYLGEHEEAEKYLVGVRKYLSGLTDNVLKRQWHVFRVLNSLKLYEKGIGFKSEQDLMDEIQPIIKKVEIWAGLGPLLKPYLAFIYAELERVTGEFKEARSLYLDAIDACHEQNYTMLEGHLNECLGELLLQAGRCSEEIYFEKAAHLYGKCHAERKETNLIEKYSEYFEEEKISYSHLVVEPPSCTIPDLDIEYLMKSSIAISAEIEQEALAKKIMNVVIESSGAGAGYLLIEEEGDLVIWAESHATDKEAVKTFHKKLEESSDVCKAVVRYVFRTGERVILNNAAEEGVFKDNPEVQNMQLRSVLCLPVIKQSKMIGILYLENRLSNSVFTSEKMRIIELLMSQAAISLENSRLIESMKTAGDQIKQSLREKRCSRSTPPRQKQPQIIHSMLSPDALYQDEQAIELFKESENRIYSMALIHEKLYQSESLAKINLPEYIQNLVANLFLSYGVSERTINPKICVENAALSIDTVIPCALIINELVSNSLKYAFPDSLKCTGKKEICIDLRHDIENKFKLIVSDNGVGLPKGLEIQNCGSLGLKLVSVLVKQLKGTIQIDTDGGTKIAITFKAQK